MLERTTLVMLLGALALTGPSLAQADDGQAFGIHVVPGLLLLGKERGRGIDGLAAPSLGVGIAFDPHRSVELHVARGNTGVSRGMDVDVTDIRLEGRYRFGIREPHRHSRWQPFLLAGASRTHYDFDAGGDDTGYSLSLGGGISRDLGERLSLRFAARGHYDTGESKLAPALTMGLRYNLTSPAERIERPPVTAREAEPAVAPAPEPSAPAEARPVPEATDEQAQPLRLERVLEFGFDSAALRDEHTPHLDAVARFMRQHPEATATLEGHTDSVGPERYNQGLSERRAAAVRDHLVAAGVAAERLTVTGYGELRPVADNETAAGRQRNRRVVAIAVQSRDE